ncbi:MAG: ferrous iron transport protein A [Proteobacteria bacterium]|nr:ferrous iron transport protein A [Pseudomonadota bacterium]MBQ9242133.1 ferrous iron transport protein A [Pseudomonadota bacterium]
MSDTAKELNIYTLETGKTAIVKTVNADEVIRQRLLDMGLLPNIEVMKERCALGGDPVWIRLGNVQIALRKNEAEAVMVECA